MLLVIFGAGASYDSVLHFPTPRPPSGSQSNFSPSVPAVRPSYEDSRPPLANQLFDNREQFVLIMNAYEACKPVVNLLRGDVQVEKQLATFEEQAKNYPPRRGHLAAIRYYLHHMLWSCQDKWQTFHHGITNYVTFLDVIDRWCHEQSEQVCYVTFNYDTMVERSMAGLWQVRFDDLEAYLSNPGFKLIKLHGSIDWALQFKDYPAPATPAAAINEAPAIGIRLTERYRKVVRAPAVFDDGSFGFPALAIPIEKKNEFSCPPEHLSALADVIPKVTKIITIGWRATEQHFLTMLSKPLTGLQTEVDLMVVSGSPDGVTQTTTNLALVDPNGAPSSRLYTPIADGFSGLMRNIAPLDAFLRYRRPT